MSNILVRLIQQGRIRNLEQLKGAYHKVIMKAHPDAVGSERYLEKYLELDGDYQEARSYLIESTSAQGSLRDNEPRNRRLAFFQQLLKIESLEIPYAFPAEQYREKLHLAKKTAMQELLAWKSEWVPIYESADLEYVKIKSEKPMGPYLKHALALNIRPLLHNIVAYHLSGRDLYAKQAKQNLSGIMHQLSEKRCIALREFLSLLLEDVKKGAAILD